MQLCGTKTSRLKRGCVLIVFTLIMASCSVSVTPIYFDEEQAVAERAVENFHALHNGGRFQEIYYLVDDEVKNGEAETETLARMKQTFEKWGKVQNTNLTRAKVFASPTPRYTSQVKLSYDTRFERGEATELFAWNIKGDEARLAVYQIIPAEQGASPQK